MKRIRCDIGAGSRNLRRLSAQEKSKGAEMTGMLCSSKCAKQDSGKSACDASCKGQGGDVVFVEDHSSGTHRWPAGLCSAPIWRSAAISRQ